MENYNLKQYAHIGDSVYEVFIRRYVIDFAKTQKNIHNMTTKYVNASFQSSLIPLLDEYLSDEEREIVKRGRNIPLTISKKSNPKIHTLATAFEVLIGYLYLEDRKRLDEIFEIIEKKAL